MQSVGYLLFLEYALQHVSLFETTDALMVVVPDTVQLVFPLPNLLLEVLQGVHHPTKPCHLCGEGFVPNALKGIVNFVMSCVVAEEMAALFVGVLRHITMIKVGGGVDVT